MPLCQADREEEIRVFLRGTTFTADDVAETLHCSRSVANHVLRKAQENGVVKLDGTDNKGWSKTNLWQVVRLSLNTRDSVTRHQVLRVFESSSAIQGMFCTSVWTTLFSAALPVRRTGACEITSMTVR